MARDMLLYCSGECNDSLRDRVFYLVRNVKDLSDARERVYKHSIEDGTFVSEEDARADADDQDIFCEGDNLSVPTENISGLVFCPGNIQLITI